MWNIEQGGVNGVKLMKEKVPVLAETAKLLRRSLSLRKLVHGVCYRVNVCVPLEFTCRKQTPDVMIFEG